MKIKKILYLLTPPVIFKLFDKFFNKNILNNDYSKPKDLLDLQNKGIEKILKIDKCENFWELLISDSFANLPIRCKAPSNQLYLDDLINNGYVKISGLFNAEEVDSWRVNSLELMEFPVKRMEELRSVHGIESMQNIQEFYLKQKINYELVSGIIRYWVIEKNIPSTNSLLYNPIVRDIVSSYFGGKPNDANIYLEYKYMLHQYDPNIVYHTDSPFKQLKVWLLLDDVNEENGPLVYIGKTHKMHEWRIIKDFLNITQNNNEFNSLYSTYSRMEMAKLAVNHPSLVDFEKKITGKKGELIIADTCGVHGGTILEEGHRIQLGMVFTGLGNLSIGEISI
jgi:hypothetical protein